MSIRIPGTDGLPMKHLPPNFKDLPPGEQDKVLNEVLAMAEATFADNRLKLSSTDSEPADERHHLDGIHSALGGVLDEIRNWRLSIHQNLSADGKNEAQEDVNKKTAFSTDDLCERLRPIVARAIADPRWENENDDLGVSVLGMLVYGMAIFIGRTVMFLDITDIDAAVTRCICEHIGSAQKWTSGLIADANQSAFNPNHHPGQHELIGVGHSYFGANDEDVVNNIFANIHNSRKERA